jgi:hypothetical protein
MSSALRRSGSIYSKLLTSQIAAHRLVSLRRDEPGLKHRYRLLHVSEATALGHLCDTLDGRAARFAIKHDESIFDRETN